MTNTIAACRSVLETLTQVHEECTTPAESVGCGVKKSLDDSALNSRHFDVGLDATALGKLYHVVNWMIFDGIMK